MKSVYSSSEVAVRIKEELKEKKITAKKMLSDLELGPATILFQMRTTLLYESVIGNCVPF